MQLLILEDRRLSRWMPPQDNSTVDIDDHRHAGVGPSAEPYVMAAVRADGADAKDLNPSGLCVPTRSTAGSPGRSDPTFVRNPRALVSDAGLRGSRSLPAGQRRRLLYLEDQLARLPHQFSNVRAFRNSVASIAAMLKRVLVASRGA